MTLRLVAKLCDRHALDVFHHEEGGPLLRDPAIQHLGDVGMIHDGQRLPLSLETQQHLTAVHTLLNELDRHAPPNGLQLLGNPDRSHSAFANLLEQPVAVRDDLARG